jgi:hypothetical protein
MTTMSDERVKLCPRCGVPLDKDGCDVAGAYHYGKCQFSELPESADPFWRHEAKCNRIATCELVDAFGEGKHARLCNRHFYGVVDYKAEKYGVRRGPREWWGNRSEGEAVKKPAIEFKLNNTCTNDPCAFCDEPCDPGDSRDEMPFTCCTVEPFKRGTWRLVCDDCAELLGYHRPYRHYLDEAEQEKYREYVAEAKREKEREHDKKEVKQ